MEKKIAIFDDDPDILSVCAYIFEELGWLVYAFSDCGNILDKLANIRPAVILMDNWIPDEGGIVATRILKNAPDFCKIPVVYFSANADIRKLAQEAGADTYLAKPFDIEELEAVIKSVLAG